MSRLTGAARLGMCMGLLVLASCELAGEPAEATMTKSSPISAALPGTFIAKYAARAKLCKGFIEPPWVSWLSYSSATVGDKWTVASSSTKNCSLAEKTGNTMASDLPFDDGTGFSLINMQGYAITVGHGTTDDPIAHHVPPGWKCFALPSFWGALAWSYADLNHTGAPSDDEFAPSSGPAAGAGYCEAGATFDAGGVWHGGRFFSWAPNTATCQRRYKLTKDDTAYPAQLWSDYTLQSC